MAATLLDSLVIVDRFVTDGSGVVLAVPAARRTKAKRAKPKTTNGAPGRVTPNIGAQYGEYSDKEKATLLTDYSRIKAKKDRSAFLQAYGLKSWHLTTWRKRKVERAAATKKSTAKKTKAKPKAKKAKPKAKTKAKKSTAKKSTKKTAYPCGECGKVFFRKNSQTMHERYCEGE
jgi:hypothetical protein